MNTIIVLLLTVCVVWYFNKLSGNPMNHSSEFQMRRVLNWLPMGLTYAFLYMGRYNLTVAKNALGDLMDKSDFGVIGAVGTVTYALAFLVNGPLTDRIGGRKAMLIGAFGAAFMNLFMGILTYLLLVHHININIVLAFSILYGLNMYFQSYGAVSIVKVNAHWFAVKERGSFGGVFGTLISMGIYFAFSWGQSVINATKANAVNLSFFEKIFRVLFGATNTSLDQTWWIFFAPAILLFAFFVFELFYLKDSPQDVGYENFDCGDASSGEDDKPYPLGFLLKKILTNKIILAIGLIEFCTGILRNGIMHWYFIYAKEAELSVSFFKEYWGELLFAAGVFGGMLAGFMSDKIFGSRRGPVAAILYAFMFLGVLIMFGWMNQAILLGIIAVFISFCVIGVHGMLSGTATADFGGRKGAATAVGLIDGLVYLGTGVQFAALGFLTEKSWNYWPLFLIPFSILGTIIAIGIWKAVPNSKSRGK